MVDTLVVITESLAIVCQGSMEGTEHEPAENDCSAHPEALTIVPLRTEGADCKGKDEKTISKEENRP